MVYGAKKKSKPEKKMKGEKCSACGDTQHKVPKRVKQYQKVKHSEVFGKPKSKKGKGSY